MVIYSTKEKVHQMTARLSKAIKQLPPDAVERVADYAESLLVEKPKSDPSKMTLSWRGALKDVAGGIDSVSLQHEIHQHWRRAAED